MSPTSPALTFEEALSFFLKKTVGGDICPRCNESGASIFQLPKGMSPANILRTLSDEFHGWNLCFVETDAATRGKRWVRCHFYRSLTDAAVPELRNAILADADTECFDDRGVRSPGLMIAFQGTDGSGKSTIIQALYKELVALFPEQQICYYHCRPFLFQPSKASHGLNMDAVCPNPHGNKPYSKVVSLIKLVYCTIDYILGYLLCMRRNVKQGKLVIFDRYYYDFYLDPRRYRLNLSHRWFRFFEPMIPKPDITFVLTGDAEPIWQRKQEISLEEVRRQIESLERHQTHFAHPASIDVTRTIPAVTGEVIHILLRTLSASRKA